MSVPDATLTDFQVYHQVSDRDSTNLHKFIIKDLNEGGIFIKNLYPNNII